MDTVFIEDLRIDTVIGVYDWERRVRQTLSFDIEMAFDCRVAGASDALHHALDYHAAAQTVTALVRASECLLLEALAERVATLLLRDFSTSALKLTVRKHGAVSNARAVGVTIERSKLAG